MPSWEALAAIGEVAGAIGVLITLMFLVHQLRQNTRALRTDGFRNTIAMIQHPTTLIIQDPDVAVVHLRGNEDFGSLDDVEQDRYHYLMIQRLLAIQLLETYDDAGLADGSFAESSRAIVARLATKPGFRQWWDQRGNAVVSEPFRGWIQSLTDAKRS
jgi:hypothetical protein